MPTQINSFTFFGGDEINIMIHIDVKLGITLVY